MAGRKLIKQKSKIKSPDFQNKNFSRDSILSAILLENLEMLKEQLIFCAKKQGTKKNPQTGEEPGKIFHEIPPYTKNNKSTKFNASDTTALFLIGHYFYLKKTNNNALLKQYKKNIEKASNYIIKHLKDGLFYEDPKFSNAKNFLLKVTYWKDSMLFERKNQEPAYPICYTLLHTQNLAGIYSATKLLNSEKMKKISEKMKKSLNKLFNKKQKKFYIAIDKEGYLNGISSDFLHMLFYLDKKDLTKEQLNSIVKNSKILETKAGYRTLDSESSKKLPDKYHAETIWPFEQAFIYDGAKKFNLEKQKQISKKVTSYLTTEPEILALENNKIKKGGCDPQLWTIAAKEYFKKTENQKPLIEFE